MERRKLEDFEMYKRVLDVGVAHAEFFTPGTTAGQTFGQFGSTLSKASEQAGVLAVSRNNDLTASKMRGAARSSLYQQLLRISKTAEAISIDTPAIAAMFRLPRRSRDKSLVQIAEGFAKSAEAFEHQFVAHGLTEDFIQHLRTAAAAFESAIRDQEAENAKREIAIQHVQDGLQECQKLLKRLDVIIENTAPPDSHLTTEWTTARRIVRRQRRKKGSTTETTQSGTDSQSANNSQETPPA